MNYKPGILIVGGGILQIPAIIKAKALGYYAFLTDRNEQCPSKTYADEFFQTDTNDIDSHVELAVDLREKGRIVAVYTQGADVEYTVAMAADAANLPGISVEAALTCKNKYRMREALRAGGLNHVKFARASTWEEFEAGMEQVGFPLYVKPVDNSGSRGIVRLESRDCAKEAFKRATLACVHDKELLIESEIEGNEYSVDTILYDGQMFPAGISDRIFMKKEHYAVQLASLTPSLLPETKQVEIYEIMNKAAQAIGVRNGAFKGDICIDEAGIPKIIEVTARTSGGFDSQYRKPYSFGIDILKATIDLSAGLPLDPVDLVPRWVKWSKTFSLVPSPGKVISIQGVCEAANLKGVRNVFILVKPGDIIEPYVDCATRSNHIIISADTLGKLANLEKRVRNTIQINTEGEL